ncbi:hypothetical protein CU024_0719 [Enterococcus faecium]|nr:hypothetical protein [Enterococcus faecium]
MLATLYATSVGTPYILNFSFIAVSSGFLTFSFWDVCRPFGTIILNIWLLVDKVLLS